MSSRFEHVIYNRDSVNKQLVLKKAFEALEALIEKEIPFGSAHQNAITSLEESYMWVGKGIRDAQFMDRCEDEKAETDEVTLNSARRNSNKNVDGRYER